MIKIIGLQVNRAVQQPGCSADALDRRNPGEFSDREDIPCFERNCGVNLPGGSKNVCLEGAHHGRDDGVHAKNDQYPENNGQGSEQRA